MDSGLSLHVLDANGVYLRLVMIPEGSGVRIHMYHGMQQGKQLTIALTSNQCDFIVPMIDH